MVISISNNSERRAVLLLGLTITIWLFAIHIFGLIFTSFEQGLIFGTGIPSLLGWYLRGRSAKKEVGMPNGLLLALALIAPIYLLPAMIRSDFHDKLIIRPSHFTIVNNILNGVYPPKDPIFAHTNLRYHYGVDTLAAVVSIVTRVRFDIALDIVSFCGLAYTILTLGTLGGALFGPAGRLFTGFLGAFHGGFTWFYPPPEGDRSFSQFLMGMFHEVNRSWLSSPSTSTLFQMPFSLGYPLFALTLLLAIESAGRTRAFVASIALFITVSTLSFCNITLFLTTGGALVAALGLLMLYSLVRRTPEVRAVYFSAPLVALASAFALAMFISGFADIIFSKGPSLIVKTEGGIGGTLSDSMVWHWGSFGLLIPLGLFGLLRPSPLRIFFLIHIIGSLYILNTYRYRVTWDIVKFSFAAAVSLAILSAGTIVWIWRHRLLGKIAALIMAVAVAASAVTFHIPFWQKGPPPFPFGTSLFDGGLGFVQILPDELKTIQWLRAQAGPEELVLRVMDAANLYSCLGGLPIIQPTDLTAQLGYSEEDIVRRAKLAEGLSPNLADYKREGVRWIVVHTDPRVGDPYLPMVVKWTKSRECSLAATFGDFQVYRVSE